MTAAPRPAAPADASPIHALVVELAEDGRLAHTVVSTPADRAAALSGDIAERDGRPAGLAPWFYGVSTFAGRHGIHLEGLDVRPEHRGLALAHVTDAGHLRPSPAGGRRAPPAGAEMCADAGHRGRGIGGARRGAAGPQA